jgi:hypothetical protein
MIITKSEIISLAFARKISDTKILDNIIQACELKYIKPVLTEDLWDAFYADPTNASYTILLAYCKNALAWWVKYTILPEVFTEISDTGVHQINANNAQTVTDQRFIEVRANCADIAQMHTDRITEYLNDNYASFPLYSAGLNPDSNVEISGGIVFRKDKSLDETEDGPEKWNKYY